MPASLRPTRRLAVVPLLVAAAWAGLPGAGAIGHPAATAKRSASTPTPRFFAPRSIWNAPLALSAARDPASDRLVEALVAAVRAEAAAGLGPGFGTRSRAPIYTVGPDAPTRRVQLDTGAWAADLQQALDAGVPIPKHAVPAKGDGSLVVWQPSSDTLWEFFQLQQALHAPRFARSAEILPGGRLGAGTYSYKVTAVNGNGETTALRNGLVARVGQGARIRVTWAPIRGATGYRVYRSVAARPFTLLGAAGPGSDSFLDDGTATPSDRVPPVHNGAATPGQWRAAYGGRMRQVSTSPGHYRDVEGEPAGRLERRGWGATATSLPLVAGMVTKRDVDRGRIDHALAIGLPNLAPGSSLIAAGRWAYPAQRSDGKSSASHAIPAGTRLRLDPGLDLGRLQLTPFVRMLAEAAQRYGVIVQDGSAATVFYGEDPAPYERLGQGNFWERLIGPRRPGFLAEFPWEHLQVLAAPG